MSRTVVGATEGAPIAPASPGATELSSGDVVELAGYGVTESGTARQLEFLAESIVALDETDVVVSGFGANGACDGDSGGPLLARDTRGAAVVLGVLASGSPSCREEDRYVRLDVVRTWLETITGPYAADPATCGNIDERGRCLNGRALRCSGTELVSESCASPAHCGWDTQGMAFRCVSPGEDPCEGVDSFGGCRDNTAIRCLDGKLEREPCGCGQTCRVEGRTGEARCS
jgi:hypothetical protein